MARPASLALAAFLAACSSDEGGADPEAPSNDGSATATDAGPPACVDGSGPAVVFDIDGTLTLSDDELLAQFFGELSYDQKMRTDAVRLTTEYADRGYWILYVTARPGPENVPVGCTDPGCPTAHDETLRWLTEKGFPVDRMTLSLAEGILNHEETRQSKARRIGEFMGAGFEIGFAYGDKESDFLAYQDVGLPNNVIFSIGPTPGLHGTTPIDADAEPTEASFTAHIAAHVSALPQACTL